MSTFGLGKKVNIQKILHRNFVENVFCSLVNRSAEKRYTGAQYWQNAVCQTSKALRLNFLKVSVTKISQTEDHLVSHLMLQALKNFGLVRGSNSPTPASRTSENPG